MQPRLEEVFKVSGVPTLTFVPPTEFDRLKISLRTPGRGLVIEGPSGIGKTTAVRTAVGQLIEEGTLEKGYLELSARKPADVELIQHLDEFKGIGLVHDHCDFAW